MALKSSRVLELYADNNRLSWEAAGPLCDLMRARADFKLFSLSKNSLKHGVAMLALGLSSHESLKELYLSENNIDPPALRILADAMVIFGNIVITAIATEQNFADC
jgi:hypothetical protein